MFPTMRSTSYSALEQLPDSVREFITRRLAEAAGVVIAALALANLLALASWSALDPSLNFATDRPVQNWLGKPGAIVADLLIQTVGLASIGMLLVFLAWGWQLTTQRTLQRIHLRTGCAILGVLSLAAFASLLPVSARWPLPTGMGGVMGDAMLIVPTLIFGSSRMVLFLAGAIAAVLAILLLKYAWSQSSGQAIRQPDIDDLDEQPLGVRNNRRIDTSDPVLDPEGEPSVAIIAMGAIAHMFMSAKAGIARSFGRAGKPHAVTAAHSRRDPVLAMDMLPDSDGDHRPTVTALRANGIEGEAQTPARKPVRRDIEHLEPPEYDLDEEGDWALDEPELEPVSSRVTPSAPVLKPGKRVYREAQATMWSVETFQLPPLALLAEPKRVRNGSMSEEGLEQNARLLEGVLDDFGVRGEIINVRPGPVVTLYELEPAPGVKSSRVIGLADDIARSMSAISARVAVVQGRNAIGIELPNQKREVVYLRELLASENFERSKHKLAICLGKTIGGEPVITDLARMPHLLVAGTTGSGKSVAINTMILSLLYRLNPDQCKLIMIDPKMLELSVYDGIPHLLTPVVTDPKKAVVALKWAVREMEDRYRKMSKLGVRNIEGFNTRVSDAKAKGKTITRKTQTGFDRETGEAIYEEEEFDLNVLPFIVIIVDEMADLMMVAGKDIEGAIQRLAQMARAAGIHIIMATQRPSVDVITGTIKANFPTRISFQVTSKIDSRTILGEQGAEQLLGQGDMLYMAGGGRISRVHGPYVADDEVEEIVAHLKQQGQPEYLEAITADDDEEEGEAGSSFPAAGSMDEEEAMSLYDRAVAIVLRDRKCSTSYIQRRLSVGYNKAASLVEQMEKEGVVSPSNHAGKREILVGGGVDRGAFDPPERD